MADRMQWEKFWYRDFADEMKKISPGATGLWIKILCEMWGNGRKGDLGGTITEFARIGGCIDEDTAGFIEELSLAGVIDLIDADTEMITNDFKKTLNDGFMIIRCRRLKKEEKYNESHKLSQKKYINKKKDDNKMIKSILPNDAIEERRKKKEDIKERIYKKEKLNCGEFQNVLLNTIEKEKVSPDEIEALSSYLASTGKRYKSHYATILNWRRKNGSPPPKIKTEIFTQCPKCGKDTTKEDIQKYESCPSCFKPATPEQLKQLLTGIGKEIK